VERKEESQVNLRIKSIVKFHEVGPAQGTDAVIAAVMKAAADTVGIIKEVIDLDLGEAALRTEPVTAIIRTMMIMEEAEAAQGESIIIIAAEEAADQTEEATRKSICLACITHWLHTRHLWRCSMIT
jgi:hypothetical protein